MWVALRTRNIVMFELAFVKEIEGDLMAGPTIMSRGIVGVRDHQRLVDRMARQTGLKIHVFGVLFVAIHAIRDEAMGRVALVARHVGMRAGVFTDLVTLLLMTRQARVGDGAFQFQVKRGMSVGMAT